MAEKTDAHRWEICLEWPYGRCAVCGVLCRPAIIPGPGSLDERVRRTPWKGNDMGICPGTGEVRDGEA
jgi:hypothetical protein